MKRLAVLVYIVLGSGQAAADDWRQFRGNDSSGVSLEQNLPVELDEPTTLRWKSTLIGRGLSGPTVVGERVFLTASSGYRDDRLHVLCFSVKTGEQLWKREFKATGRTVCHEAMCMATPQVCSDGEQIYAYYSCNDVVCLDLEGNLVWYRGLGLDYPNVSSSLGMSSSPIVADGTLILQMDTDSESLATGLDTLTGETRWKLDRPKSAMYSSPVLFHPTTNPIPQAVLQSKKSLVSLDPRTGKPNWEVEQPCGDTASTTVAGNWLLSPLTELALLRPVGTMATPEMGWSERALMPDTPTPVVYEDRVYVLKGSILSCADLSNGKLAWRLRLNCNNAFASPLAGDSHLYIVDEQGVLLVIQLGEGKGEIVTRLELGEPILGTPALAGGALYVRSDKHLWKFAEGR